MLQMIIARLSWYRGCWIYDREHRRMFPDGSRFHPHPYYLTTFTFKKGVRCRHRTKIFNWPCFRPWTYDGWCGFHNSMCGLRHSPDANRCDGTYASGIGTVYERH